MNLSFFEARGGKSFVGIEYEGNSVKFFYPEAYRWKTPPGKIILSTVEAAPYRQGMFDILESLTLAQKKSEDTAEQYDSGNGEFALKAYVWLIRDYLANGMYQNREQQYLKNQNGRIHWKKTMLRQPILSGNNVIFRDLIVSKKRQKENLLVEIYRFCVQKSFYLAGWLLNIDKTPLPVYSVHEIVLDATTKNRYLTELRNELRATFDDVKKTRLNYMLDCVSGMNHAGNGTLKYGVNEYNSVFEQLVRRVFGTVDTKKYNPQGFYQHDGAGKKYRKPPLRPDAIMKHNGASVVIDAKCYRYYFAGHKDRSNPADELPGTDSIQKQITYAEKVIAEGAPVQSVFNCFMIPYCSEEEPIRYAGVSAYADWKKNGLPYERIAVVFVDLRYLIEHCSERQSEKLHRKLLELVKSREDQEG